MSPSEYAISLQTNRLIKKSTANYKKLKKLGLVREIGSEPTPTPQPPRPKTQPTPEPEPTPEPQPPTPEPTPGFNERDLQIKMAELTTEMVADNVKKIVKSQKLSDEEYNTLLKKMLYKKLCGDAKPKPTKPKTTKPKITKKKKFKIVEPPSDSDSSESSNSN